MISNLRIASALVALGLLAGCGGSKMVNPEREPPEWWDQITPDANFYYERGLGESADMNMARKMAVEAANTQMSLSLEKEHSAIQKNWAAQSGVAASVDLHQNFEAVSKSITSRMMHSVFVDKQATYHRENRYKVYVQVKMDKMADQMALMEEMKKNDAIYSQIKSSEAWKSMEEEIAKYKKEKMGK